MILSSEEYNRKVTNFLTAQKAIQFSLKSYNKNIRKEIRSSRLVIPEEIVCDGLLIYYSVPQIYGQIKTHKTEFLMRPVVAIYTSPTYKYKLTRHLSFWFRLCDSFSLKYATPYSTAFAEELNSLTFSENASLVSFDVSNMFTNISVKLD